MEQLSLFDLAWIPSGYSDLRWFCPVCFHEHHSVFSLLSDICPYCSSDHLFCDPMASPVSSEDLRSCHFLWVSMSNKEELNVLSKIPVLEADVVHFMQEN